MSDLSRYIEKEIDESIGLAEEIIGLAEEIIGMLREARARPGAEINFVGEARDTAKTLNVGLSALVRVVFKRD
jgi:hypothetical protein